MPGGKRTSARIASQTSSSPPSQPRPSPKTTSSKRKSDAGTSLSAKRGKKSAGKEQKTIEETLPLTTEGNSAGDGSSHAKDSVNEPIETALEGNGENLEKSNDPKPPAQENSATHDDRDEGRLEVNGAGSTAKNNSAAPYEPLPQANGIDNSISGEPSAIPIPAKSDQEAMDIDTHTQQPAESKTQSGQSPTDVANASGSTEKAAAETKTEPQAEAVLHKMPVDQSTENEQPEEVAPGPAESAQPNQRPSQVVSEVAETNIVQERIKERPAEDASKTAKVSANRHDPTSSINSNGTSRAVKPTAREEETPSSILEKGIIYFFFRGRVGIDDPKQVDEIARSYMIMRPLPHGAKLGEGTIGDEGNCRLLALPKKVLPKSGKDRFLCFVQKSKTTFKDIKDSVLSSTDYMTETAGARHSPSATPVAEGVYAITTTGRESHLAYILTIPSDLGEVQRDMGLGEKGSFVTSVKNPQYSGSGDPGLSKGAEYPKDILDEFRSLRWMPLHPRLLDYENTQFIVIGESEGIEAAMEPQKEDKEADKDSPMVEMEKLEGEDEIRVKHLKGDDAVFADLGLSSQEYSKVPSTW